MFSVADIRIGEICKRRQLAYMEVIWYQKIGLSEKVAGD